MIGINFNYLNEYKNDYLINRFGSDTLDQTGSQIFLDAVNRSR